VLCVPYPEEENRLPLLISLREGLDISLDEFFAVGKREKRLRKIGHKLLCIRSLVCRRWRMLLRNCTTARERDFVYFDPPYHPVSQTAYFTDYVGDGFDAGEQQRLAAVFRALSDNGVYVMLSNSDTHFIRELYKRFRIEVVQAKRPINCRADRRGLVNELIIRNY